MLRRQRMRARLASLQKQRAKTILPSTSGTQEAGPSSQPEVVSASGLESKFAQLGITGATDSVLVGADVNHQNENINPVSSETAGPSECQLPSRSIAAELQKEFAQMGVGGEIGSILVGAEVHPENEFNNGGYESDDNNATLRTPFSGSEDTLRAPLTGSDDTLVGGYGFEAGGERAEEGHHQLSFSDAPNQDLLGSPVRRVRNYKTV